MFRSCHHSRSFVVCVDVVVMCGAKRHREFVADLQPQSSGLRVSHVVRVRWRPSADEARLAGDEA